MTKRKELVPPFMAELKQLSVFNVILRRVDTPLPKAKEYLALIGVFTNIQKQQ